MVQAIFVVFGLVVLGALLVLAVRNGRLRARVSRLERDGAELSRTLAAVQGWAGQELRAVRGEFTVSRVNDAAAKIKAERTKKRATAPAPPLPAPEDDSEERRDTIVLAAPGALGPKPSDDDEATSVIDPDPPRYARHSTMRPVAPLAHSDLIGLEDIADEAEPRRLGPEDKTPPRRGRVAVLVPAYREPEEGGAA